MTIAASTIAAIVAATPSASIAIALAKLAASPANAARARSAMVSGVHARSIVAPITVATPVVSHGE
jgi:hypothetical protein